MTPRRPPGSDDGPTHDPSRAAEPSAPQWVDPNRTVPYTPRRRSIVDRLRAESREPGPARPETAEPLPPPSARSPEPPVQRGPAPPQRQSRPRAGRGPGKRRGFGLAAIFAGIVVAGLAAGAATAWVSGWRPAFLGDESAADAASAQRKPPAPPAAKPDDTKPAAPPTPPAPAGPPGGEIGKPCFEAGAVVKAGSFACGFALDASGALSFKGQRLADRLAAGAAPARRLVVHPFSPSGRYVFLQGCDADSGGSCPAQRLADTKETKLHEVKLGQSAAAVAWSPKERVGLLFYREDAGEGVAVIAAADGKILRASLFRMPRNRYALFRAGSLKWRNDETMTIEMKLCSYRRGKLRNAECEKSAAVRYRRRAAKLPK